MRRKETLGQWALRTIGVNQLEPFQNRDGEESRWVQYSTGCAGLHMSVFTS